ncbi:hypothetical protein D9M71_750410 [compost metagenome]
MPDQPMVPQRLHVRPVAKEELIAAITGEDRAARCTRRLCRKQCWNGGRVGIGLAEDARHGLDQTERVRVLHEQACVSGAEQPGHVGGPLRFVMARHIEADGNRLHGVCTAPLQQRCNQARIDATGQQGCRSAGA